MTLNLCVLTPNRNIWNSKVKKVILSTNSGQIGVLPNHAAIVMVIDIGLLRISLNGQWLTVALMGGFAGIGNNANTTLGNNVGMNTDIDPQEAQEALEIVEANLRKVEGKKQVIEAKPALRRARTRVEAINDKSYLRLVNKLKQSIKRNKLTLEVEVYYTIHNHNIFILLIEYN